MSLSDDLLTQARHLAVLDRGRPKQANLRRAISAAYYALFHLLAADAAARMSPSLPPTLAARVARSLNHTEMRDACKMVYAGNPSHAIKAIYPQRFGTALQNVAEVFVALQTARHTADYDVMAIHMRLDTLNYVARAETAFADWKRIRKSDEATVFLAALLFAKRWDR